MKTYVLILSKTFPTGHLNAGQETKFKQRLNMGICYVQTSCKTCPLCLTCSTTETVEINPKIHTIRANYPLWEKRIKAVQEGKAVLSIRQWMGKPYHSKQEEIIRLTAANGIGIQKLTTYNHQDGLNPSVLVEDTFLSTPLRELAKNDGLSFWDFMDWYEMYNTTQPLAIIHFTPFRY